MVIVTVATYGVTLLLFISSKCMVQERARKVKNVAFYIASCISYGLVVFFIPNVVNAVCI